MNKQQWSKAVKERDGYRCVDCGASETESEKLQTHHIVPMGLGGQHVLENGATLCYRCHRARHRGEDSPAKIGERSYSGISSRNAKWILGVDSGTLSQWRVNGYLPPVVTIEDIEIFIEKVESREIPVRADPSKMRAGLDRFKNPPPPRLRLVKIR